LKAVGFLDQQLFISRYVHINTIDGQGMRQRLALITGYKYSNSLHILLEPHIFDGATAINFYL
jgi:hypothetical protein